MAKRINIIIGLIFLFCSMPLIVKADYTPKRAASDYLVGAVPEIDGKVVFNQTIKLPGLTQAIVFNKANQWLQERLQANQNNESRMLYNDAQKGILVATGSEWIVFKSTALSLDRTEINYQLTIICQDEAYSFKIERIRYNYGDDKYFAEEWITDKYALNKAKTKLIRGLAKWRIRTVDWADDLLNALQKEFNIAVPQHEIQTAPLSTLRNYRKINPADVPTSAIQMGTGKLIIQFTLDNAAQSISSNIGGSIGKIGTKNVVYTIFPPEQIDKRFNQVENYTVTFYHHGATKASVILKCKSLPAPPTAEGQPQTYIGEIVEAFIL